MNLKEWSELSKDARLLCDRMGQHLTRSEWRAAEQASDELAQLALGVRDLCTARQRINAAVTVVRSARNKEARCSVS